MTLSKTDAQLAGQCRMQDLDLDRVQDRAVDRLAAILTPRPGEGGARQRGTA